MPTLPVVPKVVRIDHHWSQAGAANIQIRQFFQYTGTLNLADAGTFVGTVNSAMGTLVVATMMAACPYLSTELTDLSSDSSPQVVNSTPHTGTDTVTPNPGGLAFVIKQRIARRYRGGHSRVYLPGISPRHLSTATLWDPSFAAGLLGDWVTYINTVLASPPVAMGTVTPVSVSYFHGFTVESRPPLRPIIIPSPRPTPLIDEITNFASNPAPASQRRRNVTP